MLCYHTIPSDRCQDSAAYLQVPLKLSALNLRDSIRLWPDKGHVGFPQHFAQMQCFLPTIEQAFHVHSSETFSGCKFTLNF